MDKRQMECKDERIFKNTYVAVVDMCVKIKKILLSMKEVTDELVHDSKALPELVQNIIKSNSVTASKLFADGASYDSNAGVFRCLADNGIFLPYCIKVRKRMSKLDGKEGGGTSLGIYQFWHKEMIYRSGRMYSVNYGQR